jgi:hypothetical protein
MGAPTVPKRSRDSHAARRIVICVKNGSSLIGMKYFRQGRTELESAVTKRESSGAARLARSHEFLDEAPHLAGDSAAAAGRYTKGAADGR